ncbi:hypothetical protein BN1723_015282, partial [Verticillium longisporum]|uniref:UDP-glucose/GDP-mannose dehydrogenase C-terminal domain-containing protein n=1 Tax=Verticillium longisporum TaxID=100787 RepID=A0A0G4ML55_VERLO
MATDPYLDTPELFAAGSSPACQFGVPSDRKLSWVYSTVDEYYPTTPPTELCESDEELCEAASSSVHLDREPLVAVLGVGYVGEHLVSNFARKYDVLGFDVSEARVRHLAETFPSDTRARFTCRPKDLAHATHFLISVPTLLRPDQTIDSSFLRSAIDNIATYARQGSVVVVESSVAVGMTRSLLGTLAKERGFFAGMSPERVDPGRTEPPAHAIPKIVSGLDDVVPGSLNAIIRLYSQVFDKVVPVSRPEVAEMMKLYENCQRMMCIAFANEMADACTPHKVDPYEVCRAASTKPFGYMPFAPSLGVGGHCIPVNPYYLLSNSAFPLLKAATEKMRARPAAVAERVVEALCNDAAIDCSQLNTSRPSVLVVGIGFKRGQSHLANSPGLDLARSLVLTEKVEVTWVDPLVKQEAVPQIKKLDETSEWNSESLRQRFNMIVVAFRQEELDFQVLEGMEAKGVRVEMWCD